MAAAESNNPHSIPWREWSEAAFAAARAEHKPVLLTLGATWCHWCHVMDDTSYSDARVIELVTSRFIPVRVDVDRRPDISLRYNQGGFPSVAFLTGTGEFITGRPYTPPDELATLLQRVSNGDIAPGGEPAATPAAAREHTTPDAAVSAVSARLTELYDPDFGGFGLEPKQPPWEALRFLAARYGRTGDQDALSMVETTLLEMWHGIYDRKDQGFFRYSVSRDWKVPHYEKMLVSNANLAMSYLEAFQITRKLIYKSVAAGAMSYLIDTLLADDPGLFFASQDADEPYYQGSWQARDAAATPPIDRTFYAGWNALAAHSLIAAGNALGRPGGYLRVAAAILERLWRDSWVARGGLRRRVDGAGDATLILSDQVYLLRAWLELYQSMGDAVYLARAVETADTVQRRFGAPGGGCYDATAPNSFEATVLMREQPVLDNAHWAEALLTLAALTGDDAYAQRAAEALNVFNAVVPGKSYLGTHASRRMEEDEEALFLPAGAAWGRAMDLLTHGPVTMVLVGDSSAPAYHQLHQSALQVFAPHRIIRPLDSQRDADQIQALQFPARRAPALYVCIGNRCLPPIRSPERALDLARTRPWAGK